jgi:hypothetical protein
VEADGPVPMIRIAITVEAFEAIVATLGLGSVGYEPQTNAKGERLPNIAARGPPGASGAGAAQA